MKQTNNTAPKTLDELALKPSTRALLQQIVCGRLQVGTGGKNGLLLHGAAGTGKSTTARLLPTLLEPALLALEQQYAAGGFFPYPGIMKYEASCGIGCNGNNKGITLANTITTHLAHGMRGESVFAYIILDEVDDAGKDFLASLRGLMDTLSHVVWIFTTNHIAKLDNPLIDRCYALDFGDAGLEQWVVRCNQILEAHNKQAISATDVAILHGSSNGSARNIISILQARYL